MKAVFLALPALAFFVSFAFSGIVGDYCNYNLYQDSNCDSGAGIYCVMYHCQLVLDPSLYCNDSDGNSLNVSGTLDSRRREYDGQWYTASVGDDCISGNTFVPSCSGTGCFVREAVCTGQSSYSFETSPCTSCSNGACLSWQPPQPESIIGNACNYLLNGDSDCNASAGIYCISNTCQLASNPNVYCNDSDGNSLNVSGTLSSRYRQYDGQWYDVSVGDDCISGNTFVQSCSGIECQMREALCGADLSHYFQYSPCFQCSNGACSSQGQQDQNTEGLPCSFSSSFDSSCSPDLNIYCISSVCSRSDQNIAQYCLDIDSNFFKKSSLNYLYREYSNGSVSSGSAADYCIDANRLGEAHCLPVLHGKNFDFNAFKCPSGCLNGACIPQSVPAVTIMGHCANGIQDENELGIDCGGACSTCLPARDNGISDNDLLESIGQWSRGRLSSAELLEIIQSWKS